MEGDEIKNENSSTSRLFLELQRRVVCYFRRHMRTHEIQDVPPVISVSSWSL